MFGNPKPSPDDVAEALSLLLQNPELHDGETTQEQYPSLIGDLLVAAEVLYGTTLTEEQASEAREHFAELYFTVTERDMPEAWGEYLIALTQMGDRLASFHTVEPPLEHAALDHPLAEAASQAALLARRLAALRHGLNLTDRGQYVEKEPVESDVQQMADAAAELATALASLAADPMVTEVINPLGTSGGVPITEAVIEKAAAEAEAGYDVEQLKRREEG